MKSKILALIVLMLCFSMFLVSCGGEDPADGDQNADGSDACTEHVDEDENAKCDVCEADCEAGINKKPTMVVKPIPSDVNENDYFNFVYEDDTLPLTDYYTLQGGYDSRVCASNGKFIVLTDTKPVDEKEQANLEDDDILRRDNYYVYDFLNKSYLKNRHLILY